VIIGSYRALHIAIKNDRPVNRNSDLKDNIQNLMKSHPPNFRLY